MGCFVVVFLYFLVVVVVVKFLMSIIFINSFKLIVCPSTEP